MPRPVPANFLESVWQELKSLIWVVAGVTALISAIASFCADGWKGTYSAIMLIVFSIIVILIVSIIDFIKDSRFIRQQEILKEEDISVIRGKPYSTRSISVWDLVVGDVILLETGSRIPADCFVIESVGLEVDEPKDKKDYSEPVNKDSRADPFLRSGGIIKNGNAKALVCCVGANSLRGTKDDKLETDQSTPLQRKLKNTENQIVLIALILSAVVFIQMIVYTIIAGASVGSGSEVFKRLAKAFNYTVVLAIACIPEGLPLTIGLALAFSVGEMHRKDKILVRDLASPEIMGKVEELLVGKSGTLTNAKMRVKKFIVNGEKYQNSRKDTILNCQLDQETISRIKESILFNTQARIEAGESTYSANGQPTDVAMINFLQDADIPVHLFIQRRFGDNYICELNLRSDQRWSAVAVKLYNDPSQTVVYIKGAPEDIISMCSRHDKDCEFGEEQELAEVRTIA